MTHPLYCFRGIACGLLFAQFIENPAAQFGIALDGDGKFCGLFGVSMHVESGRLSPIMQKTADIHPHETVKSIHFLRILQALQTPPSSPEISYFCAG